MLLVPTSPAEDTMVKMNEFLSYWLVVERDMLSLEGNECDKIGTSYEAFNTQGSKCGVQAGTCIRKQIKELINDDITLIRAGKTPRYFIR